MPDTLRSDNSADPSRRWVWWPGLLLTATVTLVYLNSFDGVFVFDDRTHIVNDVSIRSLGDALRSGGSRPLVAVSLAINHELGKLEPAGYHAFNLVVHVLSALLLMGIVRRTLADPRFGPATRRAAAGLALAIAMVWAVHPLQTQAVTYVIQRAESMMGMLLLLTLYCAIRGARSPRGGAWFVGAVVACGLGMLTKPVMVVAPLVVLLYDRAFLGHSVRATLGARRWLFAGLAATWLLLLPTGTAAGVLATDRVAAGYGFAVEGVTPMEYLASQAGVILHYIRLAAWPGPLVFDYQWPVVATVAEAAVPFAVVAALALLTAWAIVKAPAWGFLGAWFFLILAPTSSFVPVKDLAVEHRMYLPLAALVTLAVLAGRRLIAWGAERTKLTDTQTMQTTAVVVILSVTVLGTLTIQRNRVYHDRLTLWADTAGKRPGNARAHNHLGIELAQRQRPDEALESFRRAVAVDESYPQALYNLGSALVRLGRGGEASPWFERAIDANPRSVEARVAYGGLLATQGRLADAERQFREVVAARPHQTRGYMALASCVAAQGRFDEAIDLYERTLVLEPDLDAARRGLDAAKRAKDAGGGA